MYITGKAFIKNEFVDESGGQIYGDWQAKLRSPALQTWPDAEEMLLQKKIDFLRGQTGRPLLQRDFGETRQGVEEQAQMGAKALGRIETTMKSVHQG